MKVGSSLKSRKGKGIKFVHRGNRIYVLCETNPRKKFRQGGKIKKKHS